MSSWQKELDMTDLRVWSILLWEEHLRAGELRYSLSSLCRINPPQHCRQQARACTSTSGEGRQHAAAPARCPSAVGRMWAVEPD